MLADQREACQRAEDIVEVGGGNKEPLSLF